MPFAIALSGLNAASSDLEVTANNIANVNTNGFKESRAQFSEVFAVGTQSVGSTQSGSGVRLAQVAQQFTQGTVDFTDNALDLAIGGEGFFVLSDNGARAYTRAGAFGVDNDGYVVNSAGARLQSYPSAGNGLYNTGTPSDLKLTTGANPPAATTTATFGLNLPADAPQPINPVFDSTDPSSFNHTTSVTVYDSLGSAHTATVFFVKDPAANTWNTNFEIDGTPIAGTTQIVFNPDGSLSTPAGGNMTLGAYTPTTGAADLNMTLNFADATQYGNAFGVNSISQDGFTTGRLTGVSVDPEGVVFARFTNGQSLALGKLALANFVNPQGMQQLGETNWAESFQSGDALLGEAGTASFGNVQSGALEASNVDLTAALVQMITAQRNFQANAQMIEAADTVTQTVINIR
ncbi:MAG: flagellar hook protein FlgE [Woeseia sp.]|nr:flagellar hook protein FlgE [Woeseia sp.]MBT8097927.1 flagellar hook protein FlgE [Woeseia sp.]NNE60053.1 flagellar hook protein FlgE [Woeseia sp.]NNL55522.1 flagellar hook protein FlgE [Woeseia sp.]